MGAFAHPQVWGFVPSSVLPPPHQPTKIKVNHSPIILPPQKKKKKERKKKRKKCTTFSSVSSAGCFGGWSPPRIPKNLVKSGPFCDHFTHSAPRKYTCTLSHPHKTILMPVTFALYTSVSSPSQIKYTKKWWCRHWTFPIANIAGPYLQDTLRVLYLTVYENIGIQSRFNTSTKPPARHA